MIINRSIYILFTLTVTLRLGWF